ncbi:MAG: hypothetical protein LUO98_08760 [Methanoregula sp.]|nr:hypothetical protein [Methanoregula sp.]
MTAQRIESGTADGDALGFTGDLFSGWLERESGNRLYLHYIISRRRAEGNTQALIRSWLDRGYDVRVVMPRPVMQHIMKKFGFVPSLEYLPDQYEDKVEVWFRPVNSGGSGMISGKSAAACISRSVNTSPVKEVPVENLLFFRISCSIR